MDLKKYMKEKYILSINVSYTINLYYILLSNVYLILNYMHWQIGKINDPTLSLTQGITNIFHSLHNKCQSISV